MKHEQGKLGVGGAGQAAGIHSEGMRIVRKQVSSQRLEDRETAAGKQGDTCQGKQGPAVAEQRLK